MLCSHSAAVLLKLYVLVDQMIMCRHQRPSHVPLWEEQGNPLVVLLHEEEEEEGERSLMPVGEGAESVLVEVEHVKALLVEVELRNPSVKKRYTHQLKLPRNWNEREREH